MVVREMAADDWPAVAAIYAAGMATGLATFETDVPTWAAWDARHLNAPRLVADGGAVTGWIAASRVSARPCYAGVVEHSVYVHPDHAGRGIGWALLERFLEAAPAAGIWTVQTAIMAGNAPSLALHRRAGFREVGRRERIARRDGVWHDTVLLERRLRDP